MALSETEELELLELEKAQATAAPSDPSIPVPGHAMDGHKPAAEPQSGSMKEKLLRSAREFAAGKVGDIEAGVSLMTGATSGMFGLAAGGLNAAAQKAMGRGEPGKTIEQSAIEGMGALTYAPRTEAGKERLETVGSAFEKSKIPPIWPLSGPLGAESAVIPALKQAGGMVSKGARAVGDSTVARAAGKVAGVPGQVVSDVLGSRVAPARETAAASARKAVEEAIAKSSEGGKQDALRVQAIESVEKRLESQLEAERAVPLNLADQGENIRQQFVGTMLSAEKARSMEADALFSDVRDAAKAKEATGERVNTLEVEGRLESMLEKASGLPELETKLKGFLTAIRGKKEEVAPGAVPKPGETGALDLGRTQKKFQGETLLQAIRRKGGVESGEMPDITGERRVGKGMKGLPPNTFKREGKTLGDLATELQAEGWDINLSDVDGGVQQLRDLIRQELDGEKVYSLADTERLTQWELEQRLRGELQDFSQREGAPAGAAGKPEVQPKTFEELEFARRYLQDIAYSRDMEGYSAILRGEARTAAKSLDAAMQDFLPVFRTYKDIYREMSKPLETLGTKFGRALYDTEGGLKGNAYSKVAAQDLPGRIFSKKEGIEQLIDALAGGKAGDSNVSGEARAAAVQRVGAWYEQWLRETTRAGKPTAALEKLSEANTRASLSSLPFVEDALRKQFGDVAGMDRAAKQLAGAAKTLGESGKKKMDAAAEFSTAVQMAEAAADPAAQLKGLVSAMDKARKSGLITQEQYEGVQTLIGKLDSIEKKTAMARKLAGGAGAVLGAGVGIKTYFQ